MLGLVSTESAAAWNEEAVVFTSERIVVDTIVPSMLYDQARGMDMKADGTHKIGYIGWELFSVGAPRPPSARDVISPSGRHTHACPERQGHRVCAPVSTILLHLHEGREGFHLERRCHAGVP